LQTEHRRVSWRDDAGLHDLLAALGAYVHGMAAGPAFTRQRHLRVQVRQATDALRQRSATAVITMPA
jgi:hypothetical protein